VRHQPITNLKNKVAIVTGSARGIGKAIAERFGSLGASVVVNYATSEGAAQETVAAITRLGGTAIAVQADVADAAEYLAGDLSAFVSGQHLLLSGGGPA